ncbi:MAG: nucleotidyltransferase domain-containing protein [Elusimicrobia bacterium]|nr:nucleotidyltransferase domain-containing protein [Elusimicrobiota bacterium]
MKIQPENRHLKRLRQEILSSLMAQSVKVYLFGSRARRNERSTSDVDIGLIAESPLRPGTLSSLRERIDSLNIPYKVEIVNLMETSEEFRRQALKDAQIWKS